MVRACRAVRDVAVNRIGAVKEALSACPSVSNGETLLEVVGGFRGSLPRVRAAHAASESGVLSMTHGADEVADGRICLSENAEDKRLNTAERAEARDERAHLALGGVREVRVKLGEVRFDLASYRRGPAVDGTRGIVTGA